MMEVDSALLVLMSEGLVGSFLLVLGIFFYQRYRRNKEVAEIERFISKLANEEALKSQMLETILLENCGLDRETVVIVLQEVNVAERALLQRVVQMFLQRDPALLSEIDQLIVNLSDPYCKLLAGPSTVSTTKPGEGSDAGEASHIAKQMSGLENVNKQLVKQLDTAMKTIDEITAEYTRVFSGNQTALELENSSKKMMVIFQETEKCIKDTISELEN